MPPLCAARALGDVIMCKRPANAMIERGVVGAKFPHWRALDGAVAMPEWATTSGPY